MKNIKLYKLSSLNLIDNKSMIARSKLMLCSLFKSKDNFNVPL